MMMWREWALAIGLGFASALSSGADRALNIAADEVSGRLPNFSRDSWSGGVDLRLGPAGYGSYRFTVTKPWCGELPQWPSVDLTPTITDWSAYDRLVIDAYNVAGGGDVFSGFVTGKGQRPQVGLQLPKMVVRTRDVVRWTIPLEWPKAVDSHRIGNIHLFATTPNCADVRFAGFYLLKAGEDLPPLDAEFVASVLEPGRAAARAARKANRRSAHEKFCAACRAAGQDGDPCWVGSATSMEKIRPLVDFEARPATSFELSLARNEYESLQVIVTPNRDELKDVCVAVSDLTGSAGTLSHSSFMVAPVGYVNATNEAPYMIGCTRPSDDPGGYTRVTRSNDTGWWPDPILSYLDSVTIRRGVVQSFWVRLKCPINQAAGMYKGEITVCGKGWTKRFPLSVRVYDFTLPTECSLPVIASFNPDADWTQADEQKKTQAERLWRDPLSPINQWSRNGQRKEWTDFLADYYLTVNNLYNHDGAQPWWDEVARLKEEGRLGPVNLWHWRCPADLSETTRSAWLANMERIARPNYERAKAMGILDRCYFYGCDEITAKKFAEVAWAAKELKRAFPGVKLMTTAYDYSFGMNTLLGVVDAFVPNTTRFAEHKEEIARARAAGHEVWWYVACGEQAPRANVFIDGEAVEARQLMGAFVAKYRPDGFLYYATAIWNSERCIEGRCTFTTWDPRSWMSFHGDGSLTCAGPGGHPLPTIRLENLRDGLEDYAYVQLLERLTGRKVKVPESVCRDVRQFNDDPKSIYAWRKRLAEAIEQASDMSLE